MRYLFWLSVLVTIASPSRFLLDLLGATTILLSLNDATFTTHPGAGPSQSLFDVNGALRLAIFAHPPNQVEWVLKLRPGRHRLEVAVALDPDVWDHSDGVRYQVVLVDDGRRCKIGTARLDPGRRADHRRWVPLSFEFETKASTSTISLINDVGAAGRADYDWAYWAEPRVVTLTAPPHLPSIFLGLLGCLAAAAMARRRGVAIGAGGGFFLCTVHTVAVSLLVIEGLLRLWPWWFAPHGEMHSVAGSESAAWLATLVPDSELGYRHRPLLSLSLSRRFDRITDGRVPAYVEPSNKRIRFETDEDGFRNPPASPPAQIVLLGDSFAAADLIDYPDSLSFALSRELSVPVRNLGISGYGPQQYLAALRKFGIAHSPRVVVAVLFEGNDIHDAEVFDRWQRSDLTWERFATTLLRVRSDSITTRPHMRSRALDAFSFLGTTLGTALSPSVRVTAPDDPFNPVCRVHAGALRCMSFNGTALFRETASRDEWQAHPGWAITLQSLRRIQSLCEQAKAHLLVVLAPTKESIYLPRMAVHFETEALDRYLERVSRGVRILPGPALSERFEANRGVISNLLGEALGREGIEVLDLRPGFENAASKGLNVFFDFDIHWNETGHGEAARLIAREIASRGWIRTSAEGVPDRPAHPIDAPPPGRPARESR